MIIASVLGRTSRSQPATFLGGITCTRGGARHRQALRLAAPRALRALAFLPGQPTRRQGHGLIAHRHRRLLIFIH